MRRLNLEDYQNKITSLYGNNYTITPITDFIGAFTYVSIYCHIHKSTTIKQLHNIAYKTSRAHPCHQCAIQKSQ